MTATETAIPHRHLPVSLSREMWDLLGYTVLTHEDGTRTTTKHGMSDSDELLIAALAAGLTGLSLVAHVTTEKRRRNEHRDQIRALHAESQAIARLADAISGESDNAVVQRVLSRLTERTQHAVRSQLVGSGMLDGGA